jgi:hypothetical protein
MPQTPGFLFVAFYYTQGYGGGILSRLHTGILNESVEANRIGYNVITRMFHCFFLLPTVHKIEFSLAIYLLHAESK